MISTSWIHSPVDPAAVVQESDHLVYLAANHGVITKVKTAQTSGHVKFPGGIKVFDGDPEISLITGRINAHTIPYQAFERVCSAPHIYQPF